MITGEWLPDKAFVALHGQSKVDEALVKWVKKRSGLKIDLTTPNEQALQP